MISVIIPIYNVEPYLKKCLQSVLTNTYQDIEVICVNDGSPDGCLKILKRIQAEDSRIHIINQMNQGVQMARNHGLDAATGDYIAFIDPDDWIHPQYFQSLLNCMEYTEADMVVCGCRKFDLDEEIKPDMIQKVHYRRLSSQEFYKSYYARHMVWGRLYRRKDIGKLCFSKEVKAAEDTLFNLSLVAGMKQPVIYETNAELYFYLQRPGSLVRLQSYQTLIDFAEWYVKNRRVSEDFGTGNWAWIRLMQAIKMVLSSRYGAMLHKDKEMISYSNELLHIMLKDMLKDRHISLSDKMIHTVMILCPELYRQFRLIEDPTMKQWEQQVKKNLIE